MAGQHRPWLLLTVLLLGASCSTAGGAVVAEQRSHLQRLFDAMDKDHDGQLRQQELRQYIGALAPEYSSNRKLDQAVQGAIGRLDGADLGRDISWAELDQHLHTLLQDVKVADWVAYGLGLPQYADAFRSNAITALDFPMLVNDRGELLRTELKVESRLHRQQLLRAMQRQVLGLGSPPGPVEQLHCKISTASVNIAGLRTATAATAAPAGRAAAAAGAQAGAPQQHTEGVRAAIICTWRPPAEAGQPRLHKLVLEQLDHSRPAASWELVAELDDTSITRFTLLAQPGVYQFRIAAWNSYGRSPIALSNDVRVLQPGPEPATGTAAGVVDASAGADSIAITHEHLSREQLPSCYDCGRADAAGSALAVNAVVQHSSPWDCSRSCGSSGCCDDEHSQHASCKGSTSSNWPNSLGTDGAEGCFSTLAAADDASCSPNVVWMVGLQPEQLFQQTSPVTPAGKAAQQQLVASMKVAGTGAAAGVARQQQHTSSSSDSSWVGSSSSSSEPAMTARLAATLASAWHSSMGSWLRTLINSLLLLVLPVLVRLLPVHVLAQGIAVLARLLQLLPDSWRQRLLLDDVHMRPLRVASLSTALMPGLSAPCTVPEEADSLSDNTAGQVEATAALPATITPASPAAAATAAAAAMPVSGTGVLAGPGACSSGGCASRHSSPARQLSRRCNSSTALAAAAAGGGALQPAEAAAGRQAAIASEGSSLSRSPSRSTLQSWLRGGSSAISRPSTPNGPTGLPLLSTAGPGAAQAQAAPGVCPGSSWQQPEGEAGPVDTSAMGYPRSRPGSSGGLVSAGSPGSIAAAPLLGPAVAAMSTGKMLRSTSEVNLTHRRQLSTWGISSTSVGSSPIGSPLQCSRLASSCSAGQGLAAGSASRQALDWVGADPSTAAIAAGQLSTSGWQDGAAVGRHTSCSSNGREAGWTPGGQDEQDGLTHALMELHHMPAGKKRCSFPGCQQQFDLRHWKALLQRHYCGRCQQAFCLQHTAYSPHGATGTCGVQSRCLCISCFYDYTPEYQAFLSSRNTLVSKRSRSGPPATTAAAATASFAASSGGDSSRHWGSHRVHSAAPVLRHTRQSVQEEREEAAEGAEEEIQEGCQLARQCSLKQDGEVSPLTCSKGFKSRMLWGRGLMKVMGVVRFKHAGGGHGAAAATAAGAGEAAAGTSAGS